MKNLKWLIAALAVVCVVFGMTGCPTEGEEEALPGALQVISTDESKKMADGSYPIGTELTVYYTNPDNIKAKDLKYKWMKGGTQNVANKTGEDPKFTPAEDGVYTVVLSVDGYLDLNSSTSITIGTIDLEQFKFTGVWKTQSFQSGDTPMTETVTITEDRFYLENNWKQTSASNGGTAVDATKNEYIDFTITGGWQPLDTNVASLAAALPAADGYTGYTLVGTSTHNGYRNYTRLHIFMSADETKFVRGTSPLDGGEPQILYANGNRVFTR